MSTKYREFASQTRLQNAIECFWTGETPPFDAVQRVMPDGCADILFTRGEGKTDLQVVGTMSRYADFQLPAGQILIGVRFHPGMSPPFLRVPAHELADKTVPLEDLWGRTARGLREELANSSTIPNAIAAFERYLQPSEMNARETAMWTWLRQRGGEARLDELARLSGLGTRQLRRVCLAETGLTPKRMCRVLRFRRAASLGRSGMDWAAVAVECGYYDQAHLIRDFRELSGRTPGMSALRVRDPSRGSE